MSKSVRAGSSSIRVQITWAYATMLIAVLFTFGLLASFLFERSLTQTSTDNALQMIGQLNRITDNYISYMEDIAEVVLSQEDVVGFIEDPETAADKIPLFIASIMNVRSDIVNIILKMDDGRFLTGNPGDEFNSAAGDLEEDSWFRSSFEMRTHSYISSSHVQNLVKGSYPWVISLVRRIPDPATGEEKGTLLVDLNYDIIRELCSGLQIGRRGYVFIINSRGDIVYHPRQDLIYNNLKHEHIDRLLEYGSGSFVANVDGQEVLYTFAKAGMTGWTAVGVSYTDELLRSKKDLQFYLWLIIIISFIFILILSSFLSGKITRPIDELRTSMRQVEQGNFDIDITVECEHEVYDLAVDCDIAIKKIRELIAQIEKEQELKRRNELKALQAQINPHFLYNTLDSIIWLTESGKNDDAVEMTEDLARFFRLSLSKGAEILPIRQVIEHISCYLAIQQRRYKNTLDYEIIVNPEICKYYTLKLLLQPLVENSIYHGLKNRTGMGTILVTGERQGQNICFTVSDNGIGMDPAIIRKIENDDFSGFSRSGVGLRSVIERIRLFFGEDYGLSFESEEGKGTTIKMILPVMEEAPQ